MTTGTVVKCFAVFALMCAMTAWWCALMSIQQSQLINTCLIALDNGSDVWYSHDCQELDKKYGGKVIVYGVEQK